MGGDHGVVGDEDVVVAVAGCCAVAACAGELVTALDVGFEAKHYS